MKTLLPCFILVLYVTEIIQGIPELFVTLLEIICSHWDFITDTFIGPAHHILYWSYTPAPTKSNSSLTTPGVVSNEHMILGYYATYCNSSHKSSSMISESETSPRLISFYLVPK